MKKYSKEELKEKLSEEQFNVCVLKGTEPPFSRKYNKNKEKGMYHCTVCGVPLFSSEKKYDSRTGWPSFWDLANKENIKTEADESHGMDRTEVLCNNCGAHLGHVFEDGLRPSGLRYCINSLAVEFEPA